MIFQHTYEKVLNGAKTQTRRIVKPSDTRVVNDALYTALKWRLGQSLAVQPGRGMKAVGRIKVLRIRREDVRYISNADVKAEGFRSFAEFIRVWAKMHSPHDIIYWTSSCSQEYWQSCTRDSDPEKYQCWVIEFKLERQDGEKESK